MPAKRHSRPARPHAELNRYVSIARIHRDLSQRELADMTGLTQVTVSHIETGRTKPRTATRRLLAWKLDFEERDIWPTGRRTQNDELRAAAKDQKNR